MIRVTRRCLPALALVAGLALSGCVTTPDAGSVAAASHEPATPAMRGVAPLPVAKPDPAARTNPVRPRPVALRDTMALRALDPTAVEGLLGAPGFVRQDSGAIIWQYSVQGCVMDLFWYRSDAGLSLLHVEARGVHAPGTVEMQACLEDLWIARSQQAES
jgi:hypothetical protein